MEYFYLENKRILKKYRLLQLFDLHLKYRKFNHLRIIDLSDNH